MNKYLVPIAGVALLLCIATAAFSLFGTRYIPTHDGEYHIIRIVEFSKMLNAGYIFPRWAPDMNSGYGVPVFQYNYPLPNYAGYVMRLITHDAVYAFQWAMGFGYILTAIGAYLWLAALFGTYPALVGTAVGVLTPYVFVDLYIRGSIGEIWATGFLFFVLFFIEKRKPAYMAFAYGLLILSHNILAMIYTPLLIAYCILYAANMLWGIAIGIGLSAFFWIPALWESRYVVGLNTVNFREHFVELYEFLVPSWGSQFSGTGSVGNKVSFQLGLAPLTAIAAAMVSYRHVRAAAIKRKFVFFISVFAVAVFLMSHASGWAWELVPVLQNTQYPWRLLSLVIPVAGFCAAFWTSRLRSKWLGLLLVLLAFAASFHYFQPVTYEPRDESYYMGRQNFTDGTSSMGNSFSTIWTGWISVRPANPFAIDHGRIDRIESNEYLDKRLAVTAEFPSELTAHILYFPGWKAYVDGKEIPISYQKDGIIHVPLAAGSHAVRVAFTQTPIRNAAAAISLLSLVALASWGILSIYEHRN